MLLSRENYRVESISVHRNGNQPLSGSCVFFPLPSALSHTRAHFSESSLAGKRVLCMYAFDQQSTINSPIINHHRCKEGYSR